MGAFYEKGLRPLLFTQDPERAHDWAAFGLGILSGSPALCRRIERWRRPAGIRPVECFGLVFPNAVGLAAGMDKNARFWRAAAALGFGHVEIGTVTFRRQPGNPRPRLFRYPEHEAIINRMGFNNDGAAAVAAPLKASLRLGAKHIPLGINIGKSRAAPLEEAAEDYLRSFNLLAEYADYFTINVSSPNTPGLRRLQEGRHLSGLLKALRGASPGQAGEPGRKQVPLLLKIAPDLAFREIDSILETAAAAGIDGIIATNTTVGRPGFSAHVTEEGGMSGRPLFGKALSVVQYICRATEGRLPVIASGGIIDTDCAERMMDAGARLVQIYTGFIYRGPGFPKAAARALARHYG